jgi:hypothetical protein
MQWLMIGLLVSLGALLFAAAGLARHIWQQRKLLRHSTAGREATPPAGPEPES